MHLVEHHRADAPKLGIGHEAPQQHARREHLESGARPDPPFAANGEAHRAANRTAANRVNVARVAVIRTLVELRDAVRDRANGDAAWLSEQHAPVDSIRDERRNERGLTRARRCRDDHCTVPYRVLEFVTRRRDRETGTDAVEIEVRAAHAPILGAREPPRQRSLGWTDAKEDVPRTA